MAAVEKRSSAGAWPWVCAILWLSLTLAAGCTSGPGDRAPVRSTGDVAADDASEVTSVRERHGSPWPLEEICEPPGGSSADEKLVRWLRDTPHCLGEGPGRFRDATLDAGVAHRHAFSRRIKRKAGYERIVGGGVAMEDFDGDGSLDLYVTGGQGPNALFINRGDGIFWDCTEAAGLALEEDWTNGASAVDYDNDGDADLYVANTGPDRFFENLGGGRFEDVTERVGLGNPGRSASASWGDLDNDGWVDLVVASLTEDPSRLFKPPDPKSSGTTIYRNLDGRRFEDRSKDVPMPSLLLHASYLVPLVDLDNDRDLDMYLTLEFRRSRLYRNSGVDRAAWLHWTERSDEQILRYPSAPMGVAILDVQQDGLADMAVTNLWGQPPMRESLLINQGDLRFVDQGKARGAFAMIPGRKTPLVRAMSWGTVALDVENDADEDLYIVYGHASQPGNCPQHLPFPDGCADARPAFVSGQPDALLINDGRGYFREDEGACAADRGQGRGVAVGDLNGDGCLDLFVVNQEGSTRLLMNRCEQSGHWVEVRLVGSQSTRDAIGARVTVTAGDRSWVRQVLAGSRGVHSSSPKRLHFGLGDLDRIERVKVEWPAGGTSIFGSQKADRILTFHEP